VGRPICMGLRQVMAGFFLAAVLGTVLMGCGPSHTGEKVAPVESATPSAESIRDTLFARVDDAEHGFKHKEGKWAWDDMTRLTQRLIAALEYRQVVAFSRVLPSANYSFAPMSRELLVIHALHRIIHEGSREDIQACLAHSWIEQVDRIPVADALERQTQQSMPILAAAYGESKAPVVRRGIVAALEEALPMVVRQPGQSDDEYVRRCMKVYAAERDQWIAVPMVSMPISMDAGPPSTTPYVPEPPGLFRPKVMPTPATK